MSFNVSPGVYSREINESFVVPALGNSVGGIVVSSPRGPANEIVTVSSNKELTDIFGTPSQKYPSLYSALGFLERGRRLNVIRVTNNAESSTAIISNDDIDGVEDVLEITANGPGKWGNSIAVSVSETVNEAFMLTVFYDNVQVEVFNVSLEEKKDGYGRSMYIEDVVNGNSLYIRVKHDPSVDGNPAVTQKEVLSGGSDDTLAPESGAIIAAWDKFAVKEETEVNILINAGWASPEVQNKMLAVAESRGDSIAIIDTPETEETVQKMIEYNNEELNANSSFGAIYAPWLDVYDQFNDRRVSIPPSGYVAAAYANTAQVAEVWNAPAGSRRGVLNVLGVKRVFSEADRDALYSANINPIQSFVGEGIQIYGQKTLAREASALDRVNVRMLMNMLQTSMRRALQPFLFENNTEFVRENIESILNNYLDDIQLRGGLYDFLVTCDESNNTAQVIDNEQLIVDVFVKPVRVAEFIQLNTVITATGVEFNVG